MAILKIYKSRLMSVNVVLASGKICSFVNGYYRTKNESEIGTFDAEIANGHPHIYIDPHESEVDESLVDPMAALRHKIIEEYKASMAAATNPDNDMGSSDQSGKINAATSRDVAEAAAGGSGASVAARLTNLSAGMKA